MEGAAVNTTVGITAHSTFANGNAPVDYSLSADSSGGGFKIDQNTGVVTVADPSKIDFESSPGHAYSITVRATKNGNFSSEQTFTISVNDVAPSTPVEGNGAPNTIAEGTGAGNAVGITAFSSDINGGAVTYSLIGDTSGGGFTINATTGVITVANGAKIDYESSPGHAYTVTAQASDGTLTSSQAFTINVTDVAMTTPVDGNGAPNTIAEGTGTGNAVGLTAFAMDPSGPAATYSLIGDTSGGGFAINASTGVVTVANSSKIDFESSGAGHSYNITVQASNGVQTTSQVFAIAVTDVAPSTPVEGNGAPDTIAEGTGAGNAVGITAFSSDINGGAVTYSLIGDTSGGGFTINATTGVITVADGTKINYEIPGHAYTVTVRASDGTLTSSQAFTINVTDVAPSTPVEGNGAPNTIAEGTGAGNAVGITAFSSDINGGAVTYSLIGDTSGGGFAINPTTGVITVANGTKIDYESSPGHAYSVTVQASDGTLTSSQAFSIAVTDVAPSAPVDGNGAPNTIAEGTGTGNAVGLTAFSADPGGGPAATYVLTNDAGGRFAINSATGVVTVANGSAIDFETAAGHAYSITVQATAGALTSSQAFSIAVTDVAPSTPMDVNGAPNTIAEGAGNGSAVGLTAFSADPGGPATSYSLTDSAGGRFAINSATGVVTVANGAAIDFETAPGHAYGITVQATAGALSSTQNFSIGVANVNEAPAGTDKTVTMIEGDSYTFSVADFGFSDPSDSSAPNSLLAVKMTTVPGAGTGTFTNNGATVNAGDSVSAANIAAGLLVFTPALHANGSPEAAFTFQVQDNGGTANGGVDLDQSPNTVTINVNAVNDAPINSVPGTQSVNEEGTLTFSSGTGNAITISDVDVSSGNETVTLTVTGGTLALGSTAGLASFTNNAASITLTGTVANVNAALNGLTYTGNLNFNGADTLVVSTNDNGNTGAGGPKIDTDNVTINVAPVNDAPVNGVPGAQTVNEDTALVFTGANAISISDVDANGGNETVTLSVASGALTLNGTAGLAFTVGGGTGDSTMTFSGTVAAINTALNGLSYQGNLNFNGSDTLNITTNDNGNTGSGGALSDTDSVTINVTPVNDAPVVTAGHTLNYTENQATTAFDPAITVTDVDNANLASATVQITGNYVNGQDVLGFTNQNGITGSFSAATGTLTLTGSSSVANYQTALASVTYVNTSDNPSGAARTVTIITNDGAASSVAATDTINVTPVNDAPVVTAGHTLNYTENQVATAIDPAIAVSDVDSANLASATVQITGNYVNGQDVLAFSNTASITGTFDPSTGKLTLSGSDTVANYQAALASVTYVNTSDNPSGAARTVTFITNDGALNSVAATDTINVTPVNDAPVAIASHTLGYTENDPATAVDTAFAVSDVDSANLSSATVQITGNYVNGQDVLEFSNTASITGTFDPSTGKLTLTGSDTVANYQSALRSVTYVNTSDDPSGASRTVTIITSDGAASSGAVTDTITVQPVNDAPTLVATGNNPNYSNGVDLFSAVTASTIEAGQSLAQLKLTVTNISGTATDSLTIDGTTVALTHGNFISTSTPGVTARVTILGSTATVTIDSTPGLSNAAMAALVDGLSYTDTNVTPGDPARVVTITQLHDTGGTSPGVDTTVLNITSTVFFDQAPVVTAGHTLNYTENQAATAFDAAITVTDADNANLASATVQITGGYVSGEDVLGFTTQNGISGSFNPGTGTMTLTGSSSVTNYQTALASVTYVNTSDNPSGAARTVTITANDGTVNSTPVTDTINVTPVNDAPVVTAGHTLNYTENQAATAFDPAIAVSDVDSANLASATVQITGNYVNGQDVLGFTTQNGISGSFDAPSGTMTLTGSSSVANYQTALASVTYVNSSENPSGLARTVTIITNDGTANSVAVTDTINVTPVNDAPVTTAGGTLNYTENQIATAIDATVTVSDADNANLSSATVQLTTNYVNGQDILGFTTQNGITGVFSAASGTMTLSGSSSVANYQTALRSVTYFDNSDNPSGLDRTVVYTANDGAGNGNSSTSTIHVTPVNDAPVVTATGTLAYTENQAATAIAPALTVTDADTATLTTATVTISANYVNGEDVLAFATQNGISGSFDAPSGTMTLTGTASVANYQTAMESVTYVNTSENPSTAARTVTFAADDGQGVNHLSAGSNHTITVASVDDAPVNNGVPGQFTVMSGFTHAITGLSISDVDAGAGNDITTTLTSVGTAFVTVGAVGGGAAITGNGTNGVTLTGTIGQINTSLAGSVVYTAADNVTTSSLTTLTIATNDHGHTGTGGPITDTDIISVGVTPQVWFIDQAQAGLVATEPRGSQLNPFTDITEFNAASLTATGPGNNDTIYIKAGTYTGPGINLKDGQTLLGDDQALSQTDPFGGPAIVIETSSGARPTINVTTGGDQGIDLASGNTIHGINITTAAGTTGLDDGNNGAGASDDNVGSLTVSNMAISGAGKAIDIDEGGTLGITLDSLASSASTTQGVELANVGGSLTVNGATNIGNADTDGISIHNTTSFTGTFTGAVTVNNTAGHAGDGIDLQTNTGGTFNLNGGTYIDVTGTNAFGFRATSSGTVNIANPNADNHINSAAGTAFLINPTTVNANVTTITSSGGTGPGISLTGMGGSLTVGTATISGQTGVNGHGILIDGTGGPGTGTVSINSVGINNVGGDGIDITGANGAITVTGGNIGGSNDPAGLGVDVNAGSGAITIGASITKTTPGHIVDVTGHTAGALAFSGAISATGAVDNGISLTNNTGGSITFSNATNTLNTGANTAVAFTNSAATGAAVTFSGGNLDIDTTSGKGINATSSVTGAGSLTITGANNTIASGTGTALTVDHTTIGASGLTFKSIGSSGAANGIVLNTTGASGGLTVTGDGTNATQGGNSSGGTIANSTGVGISLSSTINTNLNYMTVSNSGTDGITVNNINGFTLNRSTVTDSSGTASDNGIQVGDFSTGTAVNGTINITNSVVGPVAGNAPHDNIAVGIGSGTSTWNITGNNLSNSGNIGLNVEFRNAAVVSGMTISNNTFHANNTNTAEGIHIQPAGGTTGSLAATIQSNNFANNNIAIDVNNDASATTNYKILNNTIINDTRNDPASSGTGNTASHAINVFQATTSTSSALMNVTLQGNTIGSSSIAGSGSSIGNGIRVNYNGNGDGNVLIDNNTIREAPIGRGIEVIGRNGTGQLDVTITNNNVDHTDLNFDVPNASDTPLAAILVQVNQVGTAGYTIRANIHNNTVPTTNTAADLAGTGFLQVVQTQQAGTTTFQLVDNAPASPNALSELQSHNTGSVSTLGTITLIAGPIGTPPMNAAAGGVQATSPTPGEIHLSQAQLDSVVAAAISQWAAAGASASQLAAMLAVTFTVDDLGGKTIGEQMSATHISIDNDAAGHGWFVDPTPNDNSEFTHAQNAAGTDLLTDPSSAAAGHLDLLTTVTHELGHVIGLDDVTDTSSAHDLMYIDLVDGERRLPDATDVAQANAPGALQAEAALPLSAQAAASTPIVVGTAANDTIDAGHGGNILFGGAGADHFVFGPAIPLNAPTPAQVTHVADYHAAEGDSFDFSAITSAFHNSSVNDALVVRAVEDASGKFAMLQVDHIDPNGLPSAPNWVNVAQLDGAHAGDAVNVLIDNHSVHLAQIHVDLLV
jgi:hypothetical protein